MIGILIIFVQKPLLYFFVIGCYMFFTVFPLLIGAAETEDGKTKKKRRSSLSFLEQWMWCGKRRSARVRSTVKREAEREDGSNLEEALKRLVPQSLL